MKISNYKIRVLVCGGRDYPIFGYIYDGLNIVAKEFGVSYDDIMVITGGARGSDAFGEEWAHDLGVCCKVVPADWGKYGRAAGPKRNQEMLDKYMPNIVIVAPGGRGTADMRYRAAAEYAEIIDIPAI